MDGEEARWDGYLSPRMWLPGAIILFVAAVAFGTLWIVEAREGDPEPAGQAFGQCDPGDPSCTLRQAVHWHADIAMVINGEPVDFSQPQYLSTEEKELAESAHFHEPRHSVVHVHYEQTTWSEFFQSLGIVYTDACITLDDGSEHCNDPDGGAKWTFVKNGVLIDSLRFNDIGDLDRVLFWYGEESPEEVLAVFNDTVSDEACIPSGLCSDRFPPGGVEKEPCSVGSGTCN